MKRFSMLYGLIGLSLIVFPFTSSLPRDVPSVSDLSAFAGQMKWQPDYQPKVKTRWRADKAPPRHW